MSKLKRLATKEDVIVDIANPLTDKEIIDRQKQYDLLEPKKFATRYNNMLYRPVSFNWNGKTFTIERPIVSARKDGKSYIYANFNPKYAQIAITIMRTYYNFCLTYNTKQNGETVSKTPAQRLGITDKEFDWNDIIYLR